jgi:hypothetical protein
MSLLFKADGSYPQVTIPNWPGISSLPLSCFCWTLQHSDIQHTPIFLADPGGLGCVQRYDYGSGNYVAIFFENWWNYTAGVREAPLAGWLGWGASFPSLAARTVFSPNGGSALSGGTTDHYPDPYTRLLLATDGNATDAMAELAVWNYELTTADVAQLQAGRNPTTIRPDKLLIYMPLRTDVKDYGPSSLPVVAIGGWTAAYGGTHPPVDPYSAGPPAAGHTPQFAMVVS